MANLLIHPAVGGAGKAKPKRVPTSEQMAAIDTCVAGKSCQVVALAGSGKTSTLEMTAVAKGPRQKGVYVSFAKSNADDAKTRFPGYVKCATGHSLAYREFGHPFQSRLNTKLNGKLIVEALGLPAEQMLTRDFRISGVALAYQALTTVTRFCQSVEPVIDRTHLPWEEFARLTPVIQTALAELVVAAAQRLWKLMSKPDGTFPTTHDVYMKLWQLSRPRIPADYIMLDEAQDSNPVLLDVLLGQRHSQLIFVGDQYQGIYEWRGARNAMRDLKTETRITLTQSFRFGPRFADIANAILHNFLESNVKMRGTPGILSRTTHGLDPDAVICRTNGALIGRLISTLSQHRSVGIAGGTQAARLLLGGCRDLMERGSTGCRELALFQSWDELREYAETPMGQDMRVLIKQIDRYGINPLLKALDNTVAQDQAKLVLTTAHRAKGLEWNKVTLGEDFSHPLKKNWEPSEGNLLYVAATRARREMDIGQCEAISQALSWDENKAAEAQSLRERERENPMGDWKSTPHARSRKKETPEKSRRLKLAPVVRIRP